MKMKHMCQPFLYAVDYDKLDHVLSYTERLCLYSETVPPREDFDVNISPIVTSRSLRSSWSKYDCN